MKRRLAWTLALMAAGVFVGLKLPVYKWRVTVPVCGLFGALIGFGFGTIFTHKNSREAIPYWSVTVGLIGLLCSLEGPITDMLTGSAIGLALGAIVGVGAYIFDKLGANVKVF